MWPMQACGGLRASERWNLVAGRGDASTVKHAAYQNREPPLRVRLPVHAGGRLAASLPIWHSRPCLLGAGRTPMAAAGPCTTQTARGTASRWREERRSPDPYPEYLEEICRGEGEEENSGLAGGHRVGHRGGERE